MKRAERCLCLYSKTCWFCPAVRQAAEVVNLSRSAPVIHPPALTRSSQTNRRTAATSTLISSSQFNIWCYSLGSMCQNTFGKTRALGSVCEHDEALSGVNKGYSLLANRNLRAKTRTEAFKAPQCVAYQVSSTKVNREWRRALSKSVWEVLHVKKSRQTKQTITCINRHITRTCFECTRLSEMNKVTLTIVTVLKRGQKGERGKWRNSTKLEQTLFWKSRPFKPQT